MSDLDVVALRKGGGLERSKVGETTEFYETGGGMHPIPPNAVFDPVDPDGSRLVLLVDGVPTPFGVSNDKGAVEKYLKMLDVANRTDEDLNTSSAWSGYFKLIIQNAGILLVVFILAYAMFTGGG